MDLYNACDTRANKGLEELLKFLKNTKGFLWIRSEWNGIISIDVECFVDNKSVTTEFLGCWEFNEKGQLIE